MSEVGVEQTYKCGECGETATVSSDGHDNSGDFDELKIKLGCSNGHRTKDMFPEEGMSKKSEQDNEPDGEQADSAIRHDELKFADEYIASVLDGEKTATVRVGKELPAIGTRLQAVTPGGSKFATLEVRRTAACLAIEAVELLNVFGAEYGSETADELLEGLNKHYDGVQPSSTVQVIVFEVIR